METRVSKAVLRLMLHVHLVKVPAGWASAMCSVQCRVTLVSHRTSNWVEVNSSRKLPRSRARGVVGEQAHRDGAAVLQTQMMAWSVIDSPAGQSRSEG